MDVLLLARLRGVTRCWHCGARFGRGNGGGVASDIDIVKGEDGNPREALVCSIRPPCRERQKQGEEKAN